jgi:hypothetical protein
MSLWTPGGEHEVPREQPKPAAATEGGGDIDPMQELLAALSPEDRAQLAAMSPEERARAEAMIVEMATVQQQMAETPAAVVVANHAMGLYELATIHLRVQPPNFPEAQVAIDAFAALVEALQGKLGPDEATLVEALSQIRMAFVQLRQASGGEPAADE